MEAKNSRIHTASLFGRQLNSILTSLDCILRVAPNVRRHQCQIVLAIYANAEHFPNEVSRTILKGKRKTITLIDDQTQRQYNCHIITADRASYEKYLGGQWFNFCRERELSTTFMFTPKANSKQKRVKKTQEHESGDAITVQLSGKTHFSPPKSQF
ncbi:hypothetical protein MTR_6g018740 [Medicago truncatula]|uniref:Uncharacterized protein n=1 Tax=Medicago truncatula TaxID=3880 RepID=A0A072U8E7_MEDTR|nr:hypothetical protein MTR_6g018740 [Medicago truncatula]